MSENHIEPVHIEIGDDILAVRRHLHQYPELGFKEFETTKYLRDLLAGHGIEVLDTDLETGLVAEIKGEHPGPRVAMRADIDGLPIVEATGSPYTSKNEGVMMGCGHDVHSSGLLAAAFWLADHRDRIHGSVVILFQPSEETSEGAQYVIRVGALGKIDAIIGTHNNPDYKPGQIAVGETPMMAGCVRFHVTFNAEGTHGAYPEAGTGPIEALSSSILALQTIVSRNIAPFRPVVLSVTEIHGGDVWNVVPAHAGFTGTVRYFYEDDGKLVERRFHEVVESTAAAYGITADIDYDTVAGPLVSDRHLAEVVAKDVPGYADLQPIHPSMGGEDFYNYTTLAPMVFAFIGSNGTPGHHNLHSPEFVAFDGAIETTAEFYANAALRVADELER
ncbi:amidohydrolase [Bifidobacterium sp. ESL0763]|uniref:M20 metallopeptidase family protein n=1 Tax=Bifidobacterium sp. ESL0763 TaxID=2983227 RepID=UPI0023F704BC|nr:amidohydrolase [Bifidobacterium sp. ESL0763]MDF7664055.1 amidohydrolase [Bifidobacterium sp. ESL0763]